MEPQPEQVGEIPQRPAAETLPAATKQSEKTADRPHRLTLWMGTLGPMATTCAVIVTGFFAYQSWDTASKSLAVSERSMKVGQRAYVGIENSQSSISLIKAKRDVAGAPPADSLLGAIEQSFRITNLGRTPASLKTLTLRFYLPKDWWEGADSRNRYSKDGDWWVYKQPMGIVIGQEKNVRFTNAYMFELSDAAVRAYQHYLKEKTFPEGDFSTFAAAYPVQVVCVLEFVDVFGDTYTVKWADQASQISLKDAMPARQ